MAKPSLIATKGFKYMTRRLLPGDVFEAKNAVEAMILTRVRNVAAVPKRAKRPQLDHDHNGTEGGSASPAEDLTALRAEYREKLGKNPFNGWDAATLLAKIADA